MALDSGSPILAALYRRQRDEAERLAAGTTALNVWELAALGRDEGLRDLVARQPDLVNAYADDGFTPLALAAFFSSAATVRLLLAHGADVSLAARNDMRVQALHAAVASRNADAALALLDAGADSNARQQVGYTPLMAAAGAGRGDMVTLLLDRGADPALAADDGKTAADMAQEHGHAALAERLRSGTARSG